MAGAAIHAAGPGLASASGTAVGVNLSVGFLVVTALAGTPFVVVLGAVGRAVPERSCGKAFGFVTAGGLVGPFLVVPAMQA